MFKGFEYNKDFRKMANKSVYTQEFDLLHEFLATDNKNIRFEYSTEKEAINARQACATYIKNNNKPLKVMQRGNYVFAVKTIED